MKVSVVVPCRDAEATLGEQLEALAGQRYEEPWEVVIADNGSTDRSREVARAFEDRLELRWIDAADRPGAAHARNRGAQAARGPILLFCDADDRVGEGWLVAMAEGVERHRFVASRYDTRELNPPWVAASRENPQASGLNPYTYPPFLPHAGGGGLGVERRLHERIGGFDESLPALEDTDYCWRLQLAGVPLAFVPEAVVSIRFRQSQSGIFRQGWSYGRFNVLIYKRYRHRGMPRLSPLGGLARWVKLLVSLPKIVGREGRARWLWQAGWRCGRLDGSLRYRVAAL